MHKLLTLIAVIAVFWTPAVVGKPVDSDDGSYQYDAANEFNLGPYESSESASASGAVVGDTSASEYDDYPAASYDGEARLKRNIDVGFGGPVAAAELAPSQLPEEETNERTAGKISISDLIGAVEHTLVHSAQNLAIANASDAEGFNSTETSTVIALPIELPSTTTVEPVVESNSVPQDQRPSDPLSLLSVIAVSTTASTPADDATTAVSSSALIDISSDVNSSNNITIIQTINSTQVHATVDSSDGSVERVQLQHITLFSAGAGVFPDIHAVNLDAAVSQGEQHSDDEKPDISVVCDGSESSDEETVKCAKTSTTTSTTTTVKPVTPEDDAAKAKEILKEKIAEVEAEPVILTQGI